jgi:hypothetical protein
MNIKCISIVSALLLAVVAGPTAAMAQNTTFSGQATVIDSTVPLLPPPFNHVVLADTGALPPEGGSEHASLVDASVPGLLSVQVLHAATVAFGDTSRAEASVAKLNLTVNGNTISAGFLMARAAASCNQGQASASGSSELAELVINGQTIAVLGAPNQTVQLPVGTVVINEQSGSTQGNQGNITVTALHVSIPGIADVAVSRAHADITCGVKVCPQDKDFVTGGGWISTPSGSKATFGVAGGIKNGAFWGHLTYIDHGTGMKVKGTGVTVYNGTGLSRHIEGTCEINGASGFTYKIDVTDNGEPGRNDIFGIVLSNGYTQGPKTLDGGNIQLHLNGCN